MKTQTDYLWMNTKKQKEIVNIAIGERGEVAVAPGESLGVACYDH